VNKDKCELVAETDQDLKGCINQETALFLEQVWVTRLGVDDICAPNGEEVTGGKNASDTFNVRHPPLHVHVKQFTLNI
jgi:hypothetical protein